MDKKITPLKEGDVNLKDHPNLEYEEYFKPLESVVEIGNSSEDFANLSHLSYNLYKIKFGKSEIKIFNDLKNKYLPDIK